MPKKITVQNKSLVEFPIAVSSGKGSPSGEKM